MIRTVILQKTKLKRKELSDEPVELEWRKKTKTKTKKEERASFRVPGSLWARGTSGSESARTTMVQPATKPIPPSLRNPLSLSLSLSQWFLCFRRSSERDKRVDFAFRQLGLRFGAAWYSVINAATAPGWDREGLTLRICRLWFSFSFTTFFSLFF